ncbi:hypothetical protein JTB14_014021 [Gonioctena quinquepunctata]|nr:hypothetical protein JTB14_014021 [Gonioctena quinquepunctata]
MAKNVINVKESNVMESDEVFDFIDDITDDQVYNSDIGGHSDADDAFHDFLFHNLESTTSTSSIRCMKRSLEDQDVIYDSDNSIADPNFNPNPKRTLQYEFSDEDEQPLSNLVFSHMIKHISIGLRYQFLVRNSRESISMSLVVLKYQLTLNHHLMYS